jgi:hypothetical protein
VALEHFGKMRRKHGAGIDHGVAAERGFFAQALIDPRGGKTKAGSVVCVPGSSMACPLGSISSNCPG